MVDPHTVVRLGQVGLLAMSLPLAVIAARGYRGTPFGKSLLALPVVSAGFLLSASAELLAASSGEFGVLWTVGSACGVLGFGWTAVHLIWFLSGRREVGG